MKKILITNRGEIALRIIRTAKKLNIKTVLVYALHDQGANYLKEADETVLLPGNNLNETYLNIEAIINVAKNVGADAIHPGYGFLSENATFARTCKQNGIIFIGPTAESMEAMGNKIAARETAIKAGVPVTPGITGTVEELLQNYRQIPFPILIKAAAGGGGKGMRVVQNDSEIKAALESTAREAQSYFGDSTVYIERYIDQPRHIEVQVLGDSLGNMIHLFERECSIQRRHQKIVEEAGSPTLTQEVRLKICNDAVRLASTINYQSAGTMEFLLAPDMSYYFLEMNTRIQVEHPVTELTTGVDIVEQQIYIAEGQKLSLQQEDIHQTGHAIECRIYAENPDKNFLPAPGKIVYYQQPEGEHIRIDGMDLASGAVISGDFDPMISKLITYGKDREEARRYMLEALNHYYIYGIQSNIAFLYGLLNHPDFIENKVTTKYIDNYLQDLLTTFQQEKEKQDKLVPITAGLIYSLHNKNQHSSSVWKRIGYWRNVDRVELQIDGANIAATIEEHKNNRIVFHYNEQLVHASLHANKLQLNNQTYDVHIFEGNPGIYTVRNNGFDFMVKRNDILHVADNLFPPQAAHSANTGNIMAPMPGKVIKVAVAEGATVKKGDLLLIVEAMKMENNITSPFDGKVEKVTAKENDKVDTNTILIDVQPLEKENA